METTLIAGRHAGQLLALLAGEQDTWDGECPGQKVLGALMLGCPPEVLAGNMQGLVLLLSCVMVGGGGTLSYTTCVPRRANLILISHSPTACMHVTPE